MRRSRLVQLKKQQRRRGNNAMRRKKTKRCRGEGQLEQQLVKTRIKLLTLLMCQSKAQ